MKQLCNVRLCISRYLTLNDIGKINDEDISNEVHQQVQHSITSLYIKRQMQFTHSQHVCVYIGRIQHTGDRLHKHKESDDHQEQAIDETRKYFNTTVPAKSKSPYSNLQLNFQCFQLFLCHQSLFMCS